MLFVLFDLPGDEPDKTVIGRHLSFDSRIAFPPPLLRHNSGRSSSSSSDAFLNRFALPVFFPITTNVNYLLCFRHARSGRKRLLLFVTYWICFSLFCSIFGAKTLQSTTHSNRYINDFKVWLSLLSLSVRPSISIVHRCFHRNSLNTSFLSPLSKKRNIIIDNNLSRDDPGRDTQYSTISDAHCCTVKHAEPHGWVVRSVRERCL